MTILERITYPLLIGYGWKYEIACICSMKLVVVIAAKFSNVWKQSADYYRNLVTNFFQLLILLMLTLDQYYFTSTNKINISKTSVAFILLSLLAICFILNMVFLLKDTGLFVWLLKFLKIGSGQVVDS